MPERPSTDPLGLSAALSANLAKLGRDFEIEFVERSLGHRPDDPVLLSELGTLYSKAGRLQEGLQVDLKLVRMCPENATAHYNLACSHALLRDAQQALATLERAVELGYDDADFLEQDEDWQALRDHERFRALLARLRSQKPS